MGNICCFKDDDRTQRMQIWTYTDRPHSRPYIQQDKIRLPYEYQRSIASQFLQTFQKLYKKACNYHSIEYRGAFYDLKDIQALNKQELVNAVLYTSDDNIENIENLQVNCKMRKVSKEKMTSHKVYMKLISVEYIVTKHTNSKFIIRNLCSYQADKDIHQFYNVQNSISLQQIYRRSELKEKFREHLEDNVRFIVAGVILALEELHGLSLVCRSIHQRNIVINEKGYPCVVDLSILAAEGRQGVQIESGPYICLQEYKKIGLSRSVDFWKLGILIHYMVCQSYPNFSLFKENSFSNEKISPELSNLINSLIKYSPQKRLGWPNIESLKNHTFFHDFDWKKYQNQQLNSPFLPYFQTITPKNPFLPYFQTITPKKIQSKCNYDLSIKKQSFLQQFDNNLKKNMIQLQNQRLMDTKKEQILESSMNESESSEIINKKKYNFNLYDKQYYFLD